MTLQSSGPISIDEIAAEFGLANNSVFPTAFYGKGGAPSSGALSFADFYSRSGVVFDPDGGAVGGTGQYSATVTLTCSPAATWTYTGGGTGSSVDIGSGATATSITFSLNALGNIGSASPGSAAFTVNGTSGGVSRDFAVSLTVLGNA